MTTTPPEAPPPPQDTGHHDGHQDTGPRVTRDEVRDLGRLRRSRADRKVAGVAGGLGRHLDVDPLILRVAFVVLVFFGGAGLILYGACWLLVPEDGSDRAPFNLDERSRSVALIIVGGIAALALVGNSWGRAFWFPWPVAVVALIAIWLLTRTGSSARRTPPAPTAPPQEGTYAAIYTAPTYTQPTYTQPTSARPMYTPPPPYVVTPPARVPNPRRRGPILFWFTLALIALAEGVLGIVDLAGADVAPPAYPALAVAICGVLLLVGAFFGRAGGIIAAGLIATIVLVGTTAADRWDADNVTASPTTAATVDGAYRIDVGEVVLDLRGVTDLDQLNGRTIDLEAGIGHVEVIVPRGLAVRVNADVDWAGNITLFGNDHGGVDISQSIYTGRSQDPQLTIDAEVGVGQIEVHR